MLELKTVSAIQYPVNANASLESLDSPAINADRDFGTTHGTDVKVNIDRIF
jgi:hypothetical protein